VAPSQKAQVRIGEVEKEVARLLLEAGVDEQANAAFQVIKALAELPA